MNIHTDLLGIGDRVVPEGVGVALEVADASKNTDNDGIYLADRAGSNNPIERLNEAICDENRKIEVNEVEIIEADSTTICEADNVIHEGDTVIHETETVIIEADTEICEANALICENVSSVSVETVACEGNGIASEIENHLASDMQNVCEIVAANHDDSMIRGASHNINDNNVAVGISADDIVALGEGSLEMSSETSRNQSDLNRYVGDLMLESFDVQTNLQNIISTDAVVSTELSSMCQTEIKRPISANRESEVKQEARTQGKFTSFCIFISLEFVFLVCWDDASL